MEGNKLGEEGTEEYQSGTGISTLFIRWGQSQSLHSHYKVERETLLWQLEREKWAKNKEKMGGPLQSIFLQGPIAKELKPS
jgi:hypothetical protein